MREFHLNSIDPSRLRGVTGQTLCSFTARDFLDLGCIKEHGQNLQHWFERIRTLGKDVAASRFLFFVSSKETAFFQMYNSLPNVALRVRYCLPLPLQSVFVVLGS